MKRIQRREITTSKSCLLLCSAVVAGLLLISSRTALAQDTIDWTGGSMDPQDTGDPTPTNAFFSDNYNWYDLNTSGFPSPNVAGGYLDIDANNLLAWQNAVLGSGNGSFNGPGSRLLTNDLAGTTIFSQIYVNPEQSAIGGIGTFTLAGNPMSLSGPSPQIEVQNGSFTFNNNLVMIQDTTLDADNTDGHTPYLFVGGLISGNYNLYIEGAGRTRFNVAETGGYTGNTYVGGTLSVTISSGMPYGAGYGDMYVQSGGTLQIENNNFTLNGLNGPSSARVWKASGSGTRGLTVGANGDNGDYEGSYYVTGNCGTLSFTKIGTGNQIFGGTAGAGVSASTNRIGEFLVSGGTLTFNGTIAALGGQGTGSLTAGSGGTLVGTGTAWQVEALNGGTLSPGFGGVGTMVAQSNIILQAGSQFALTLDAPTSGKYGQLVGQAGQVTLGSTLALSLGYTPSPGDWFDIIVNNTGKAVSSIFAGLPEGEQFMVGGTDFDISYTGLDYYNGATQVGGVNDVVLSVIPEPSSLVLAGFGLLGACMLRRRSRK